MSLERMSRIEMCARMARSAAWAWIMLFGHSLESKRSDFSAVVEARFGLDLPRRVSR